MEFTLQTSGLSAEAAIGRMATDMLSAGAVEGVLMQQYDSSATAVYATFVKDAQRLTSPAPLAPYLNGNSGAQAATASAGKGGGRIAVFLRPCEARALVELSKLNQAVRDSVLLVTTDCPGTLSLADYKAFRQDHPETADCVSAFYEHFGAGKRPANPPVRKCCSTCQSLAHPNSDVRILLVGAGDGEIIVQAATEAGTEALKAIDIPSADPPPIDQAIRQQFADAQRQQLEALDAAWADEIKTIDDFLALLRHCRRCYNCRAECPICYCRECVFQTDALAVEPDTLSQRAGRLGAIKMPPDTLMFHLTRMNHLAASCISCGQCTEACPQSIDIARAFSAAGRQVQKIFDYVPGNDPADELPLTVFREDELEPR